MAAQVGNAEEAEQLIRWSKFWPQGMRGLNAGGSDGEYGGVTLSEYVERANRDTFVAVQIETLAAVENVEEIAAVKGVDLLFVGPSDLSQALGLTGQFDHPRCYETIELIASACAKNGTSWGIIARNADYASRWIEHGCRLLVFGNDVILARLGIAAIKQNFAKFF